MIHECTMWLERKSRQALRVSSDRRRSSLLPRLQSSALSLFTLHLLFSSWPSSLFAFSLQPTGLIADYRPWHHSTVAQDVARAARLRIQDAESAVVPPHAQAQRSRLIAQALATQLHHVQLLVLHCKDKDALERLQPQASLSTRGHRPLQRDLPLLLAPAHSAVCLGATPRLGRTMLRLMQMR